MTENITKDFAVRNYLKDVDLAMMSEMSNAIAYVENTRLFWSYLFSHHKLKHKNDPKPKLKKIHVPSLYNNTRNKDKIMEKSIIFASQNSDFVNTPMYVDIGNNLVRGRWDLPEVYLL